MLSAVYAVKSTAVKCELSETWILPAEAELGDALLASLFTLQTSIPRIVYGTVIFAALRGFVDDPDVSNGLLSIVPKFCLGFLSASEKLIRLEGERK